MPMSPRLLRPIASGVHPEAAAWRSAVVANGGSVSASTMTAVSAFCSAIDAAGIRDRFYRLNLFCGDSDASLIAPRVPLYRGPSRTGTQYGNALDTNNNFVQGDYAETGAGGGLTGNGSSKHLNTGFAGNTINANALHLGCGILTADSSANGFRNALGVWTTTSTSELSVYTRTDGRRTAQFGNYSGGAGFQAGSDENPVAAGNIVASYPTAYRNGLAFGTDATTSQDYPLAHSMGVFCILQNGATITSVTNARLGWYSIGASMTAQQVSDFNTAVNGFYAALGRS